MREALLSSDRSFPPGGPGWATGPDQRRIEVNQASFSPDDPDDFFPIPLTIPAIAAVLSVGGKGGWAALSTRRETVGGGPFKSLRGALI
jgi:hypothetical protein